MRIVDGSPGDTIESRLHADLGHPAVWQAVRACAALPSWLLMAYARLQTSDGDTVRIGRHLSRCAMCRATLDVIDDGLVDECTVAADAAWDGTSAPLARIEEPTGPHLVGRVIGGRYRVARSGRLFRGVPVERSEESLSIAKLIVMSPTGEQSEYGLRAINTLGRRPDQTIQVLDPVVSKEHALVTFADEAYWLQDMSSRNGTFVNGVQIRGRTRLRDGDTITLGSTRIVYVDDQPKKGTPGPMENATIQQVADESTLRADYEKLRIAFELNQAIGTELDIVVLLDKILEKAFEFTNADRGVILLMDEEGEPKPSAFKNRRGREERVEISQTILNEVREQRTAVLSSDATMASRFGGAHSIMRSTMCVPLINGDELLGMLHLDTRIATGVFTEQDMRVLTVFANQAAVKIANARLAKKAEIDVVVRHPGTPSRSTGVGSQQLPPLPSPPPGDAGGLPLDDEDRVSNQQPPPLPPPPPGDAGDLPLDDEDMEDPRIRRQTPRSPPRPGDDMPGKPPKPAK